MKWRGLRSNHPQLNRLAAEVRITVIKRLRITRIPCSCCGVLLIPWISSKTLVPSRDLHGSLNNTVGHYARLGARQWRRSRDDSISSIAFSNWSGVKT
jgi:hypothetical protein